MFTKNINDLQKINLENYFLFFLGKMISSSLMEPSDGMIHDFPDLVAEFESLSITHQSFDETEGRGKVC